MFNTRAVYITTRILILLTETLSDVRSIGAVNWITQTSYDRMNLISEVVFHVWDVNVLRRNVESQFRWLSSFILGESIIFSAIYKNVWWCSRRLRARRTSSEIARRLPNIFKKLVRRMRWKENIKKFGKEQLKQAIIYPGVVLKYSQGRAPPFTYLRTSKC